MIGTVYIIQISYNKQRQYELRDSYTDCGPIKLRRTNYSLVSTDSTLRFIKGTILFEQLYNSFNHNMFHRKLLNTY